MVTPQPSQSLVSQGFSPRVVMPDGAVGRPLIVGEAPGRTEAETGIPFHPEAEAGGLFKRLMQRVGVERERFSILNCVWQQPKFNELYGPKGYPLAYTHEAIEYWKPFLHQAIEELQPPVIIGLGRTALETLTGFQDIGTTRGYVCEARIQLIASTACECNGTNSQCFLCGGAGKLNGWDQRDLHIPTICTYHPAFLNYGQRHLSGVFIRDVLAALEIAEKGWEALTLRVTPSPSPEAFKAFCEGFHEDIHRLTADIETPNSIGLDEDTMDEVMGREKVQLEIDRMSFCYSSEVGGFSIPFEEPFLSMARDLIARAKALRGWNWRLFDWPRLLQHGFHTQAREYDLMDQWRHMHRTLPASVAYVTPFYLSIPPYKHEAHSQPEWYSAMDAIVEHEIAEGMEREMKASGQWNVYERHVVDIISTNHGICTQMARNGLPIDAAKIEIFKLELVEKHRERTARLQQIAPLSIRKLKAFKGLNPQLRKWFIAHGTEPKLWREHPLDELESLFQTRYQEPKDGEWYVYSLTDVWRKVYDFNPGSHLQVKALIRHYGHKAKTDRKTKNESSGDDTLKSLITKYCDSQKAGDVAAVESYRLIRECRAIDKVLGTYVNGWKPDSHGLIHAIPGIWGDMFRISWRKPNLAATVADKKEIQIAAGFRKCICVPDDMAIVECDWSAMEAVLVAYYAKDDQYMRLARMGPHAFMASHLLNRPADLSWSDPDLKRYLAEIKASPDKAVKKQYGESKATVHGIAYGLTPFGMEERYEIPRKRAAWLQDMFFEVVAPKVRSWQQAIMQEAHSTCRLVNPWGYKMPYWAVFTWQQKRYDRLRQIWVRYKTDPKAVFAKREREMLDVVIAKVAQGQEHDAAIASLCYDLGDEAKSALAFLPRDTGSAMLKDVLLDLRDKHGLDKPELRANAHDSIVAITKRSRVDEVAYILKTEMEREWKQLDGLVIGAEPSIGNSWDKASMKEWKVEAVAIA